MWKESRVHGSGELIQWKWPTTENNLQIQCNVHQNSKGILHRTRKINPKIHLKAQKTLNSIVILSNKEKSNAGGIPAPDLKLYCRVLVTKRVRQSLHLVSIYWGAY
jgi:hypothetical protein